MRRTLGVLCIALLLTVLQAPAPASEPVAGAVLLRSDFDTWDSRWSVYGGKNVAWVSNGQLVLGLDDNPDGTLREARLNSDIRFTYGTFRVKMRFNGPRGAHAAGWAQSVVGYCDGCAEIDVVEHFGAPTVWHTLWWCPCTAAGPMMKWDAPVSLDPAEWHIYRVDWTPDGYTFRVDGEVTAETSVGLTDQPHFLILSYLSASWERDNLERDRLGRYRAFVDWVDLKANAWTTVE